MTQRVSDVNLTSKASSHQRGQRCLWKSLSSGPAASTRGFVIGLAQLDAFTFTTIFERRAHVMRVVPHVMRAAFSSAIRVACEEIVDGFSVVQAPQRRPCSEEGIGAEIGVFQQGELARVGLMQHSHG